MSTKNELTGKFFAVCVLTFIITFAAIFLQFQKSNSNGVTTSINGTDFSLAGAMALASGNTGPCGTCDYDPGTGLEFCNFNWNTGQCGGNDGGPCGSVSC